MPGQGPGQTPARHRRCHDSRGDRLRRAAGRRPPPSGKWIAYVSDETGEERVYVRPFTPGGDTSGAGPKWLVSAVGGRFPRWNSDGKQLAYLAPAGDMISVHDVTTTPVFRAGAPQASSKLPAATGGDFSPRLDRVLLALASTSASTGVLDVLLNWRSITR